MVKDFFSERKTVILFLLLKKTCPSFRFIFISLRFGAFRKNFFKKRKVYLLKVRSRALCVRSLLSLQKEAINVLTPQNILKKYVSSSHVFTFGFFS